MRKRSVSCAMIALALLLLASSAHAYIQAEISMKQVLDRTQLIFTAKVESFDAEKRQAVFVVDEHLKGKARVEGLLSGLITHAEVNRTATSTEVWRLAKFWRDIMKY